MTPPDETPDGQGTLLTTEQCLLHHRNLGLSRRDNEEQSARLALYGVMDPESPMA